MPLNTGGQLRIMSENLLLTGLNSLTTSTVKPMFPVSSLTTNFVGRPFKFNGRFLVDATNNKIYINDGTNKTATIANGDYTSRTGFASAVQTALNAVSTDFFVVWNEDVKCFTITRAGGFTLRLSVNANAVHNTMGFTGNTDIVVAFQTVADQRRFHWPFEWIKIDYGYFPEIGFLGIISDSRYIFSLTEMANVRIQANTIDDFTAPPLDRLCDVTKKGIFEFFDDDDYNYRFWKITIEDNTSTDDPALGYLYLGEFHTFGEDDTPETNLSQKRYNTQGAKNYSEDTSEKVVSESGQVYALEKQTQRVYQDIQIQMINPFNKDFLNDIWLRFKTIHPFFISIDPNLEISQNLYDYTMFCTFDSRPEFVHASGNKYNTGFGVREWL